MGKLFIGIDNGTTGTVGFIDEKGWYDMALMPHKFCQDYHKTVTEVCRVDHVAFTEMLMCKIGDAKPDNPGAVKILIERPFTMQYAVAAMMNGRRALEAVLVVLEQHHLGYEFIDSKEWQGALLPKPEVQYDKKGKKKNNSAQLKKLSHQVGQRLFPVVNGSLFPDFDGLMITEYLRRRETGR